VGVEEFERWTSAPMTDEEMWGIVSTNFKESLRIAKQGSILLKLKRSMIPTMKNWKKRSLNGAWPISSSAIHFLKATSSC
jgi:hypothetical protein